MKSAFKIDHRTYYKKLAPSNSSDQGTMHRNVRISLPKLKFLEKDGPYVPDWAVEHVPNPAPDIENERPAKPKKEIYHRREMTRGEVDITDLEKRVYEMHTEGLSREKICEILEMRSSSVGGALVRYQKKMLVRSRNAK
jgi:hypothetical protein